MTLTQHMAHCSPNGHRRHWYYISHKSTLASHHVFLTECSGLPSPGPLWLGPPLSACLSGVVDAILPVNPCCCTRLPLPTPLSNATACAPIKLAILGVSCVCGGEDASKWCCDCAGGMRVGVLPSACWSWAMACMLPSPCWACCGDVPEDCGVRMCWGSSELLPVCASLLPGTDAIGCVDSGGCWLRRVWSLAWLWFCTLDKICAKAVVSDVEVEVVLEVNCPDWVDCKR